MTKKPPLRSSAQRPARAISNPSPPARSEPLLPLVGWFAGWQAHKHTRIARILARRALAVAAHLNPMIGLVPQPSQVMPLWVPNSEAAVSVAIALDLLERVLSVRESLSGSGVLCRGGGLRGG